jgi:hypothetical protein
MPWQNLAGLMLNVPLAVANDCKSTNSERHLRNARNSRYSAEMNKCYGLGRFICESLQPFSLSARHSQTLLLVQQFLLFVSWNTSTFNACLKYIILLGMQLYCAWKRTWGRKQAIASDLSSWIWVATMYALWLLFCNVFKFQVQICACKKCIPALDLNSGGIRFVSAQGHQLFWMRFFVIFLCLSRHSVIVHRLSQCLYHPNPSK